MMTEIHTCLNCKKQKPTRLGNNTCRSIAREVQELSDRKNVVANGTVMPHQVNLLPERMFSRNNLLRRIHKLQPRKIPISMRLTKWWTLVARLNCKCRPRTLRKRTKKIWLPTCQRLRARNAKHLRWRRRLLNVDQRLKLIPKAQRLANCQIFSLKRQRSEKSLVKIPNSN